MCVYVCVCLVCIPQVSRLEQRIHAVTADNEALQADLDSMRRDLERARDAAAAASAGEGLARMPRDKWPLPVLMLVQAAEAAAVTDIAEKHVSTWPHTSAAVSHTHLFTTWDNGMDFHIAALSISHADVFIGIGDLA